MGRALTGYSVQYREGTSGPWQGVEHSGTDTVITITGLKSGQQYQARVAAVNDVGVGPHHGPVDVWTQWYEATKTERQWGQPAAHGEPRAGPEGCGGGHGDAGP